MYRKVKKIIIISCALLVLASCTSQLSYFQLLTHNDIGYWRPEGDDRFYSYSKADSTFDEYYPNMEPIRSHQVYYNQLDRKFRISNDTIYHYRTSREYNFTIRQDTFQIVSFKKNRLRFVLWHRFKTDSFGWVGLNPDTTTWLRVKKRDIEKIQKGKKVRFKDCPNGSPTIMVTLHPRLRRIGKTHFHLVESMAFPKKGNDRFVHLCYSSDEEYSGLKVIPMSGYPKIILWNDKYLILKNYNGHSEGITSYMVINQNSVNMKTHEIEEIHYFTSEDDYKRFLRKINLSESEMNQTDNRILW